MPAMPTIRGRSTRKATARPARDYSRAYLHHSSAPKRRLGRCFLTWNNLSYYQKLMQDIRAAIEAQAFEARTAEISESWARGDIPLL